MGHMEESQQYVLKPLVEVNFTKLTTSKSSTLKISTCDFLVFSSNGRPVT